MIVSELILLPALALAMLTFIVWIRLHVSRLSEMHARKIAPQVLATRAGAAGSLNHVSAAADNFMNLFELPVLFYFLVAVLYASGLADGPYVVLAIVFVIARCVHSFIHITYNRVVHRLAAHLIGAIVLWIMWGRFAWQLFSLATLSPRV